MSLPSVVYIEATPLNPSSPNGQKSAASGELLTHNDMLGLQSSDYTHIILAFFHFNDFTSWQLNYNGFSIANDLYDGFWTDVSNLQTAGKKVLISMGGAADNFWSNVDANNRDLVAKQIVSFVNSKKLDGVDLDQEDGSNSGLANVAYALVNNPNWNNLLLSMVPTSGTATSQWDAMTTTPNASISPDDIDLVNIQFYSGGWTPIYNDYGGTVTYDNTSFTQTYAQLAKTIPQNKLIAGLLPIVPSTSRYSGHQIQPNGRQGHGIDDCVGAIEALYPNVGGVQCWRFKFVEGLTDSAGNSWSVAMNKALHNVAHPA